MVRSRRRQLPPEVEVAIESLSHEGRGICHLNGKTVFVFGALPGEKVKIQIQKRHSKFDQASTIEVLKPSPERIVPKCEAFSVCGGCSLQHVSSNFQIEFKQQSLLEMLEHAEVEVGEVMPALRSKPWAYRQKARLGVKYVHKKGRVLIGFRERNKGFLADMLQCEVLIPEVGLKLKDLIELVESMDAKESIPQIEVAADDQNVVLVFRHLKDLNEKDLSSLTEFAKSSGLWIQLQPKGMDSIHNLYPANQILRYRPLADEDIEINFKASDFTQVNHAINQQMVKQVLHLLDLQADDCVLDLFCGLGNFTLPMSKKCSRVTGVEGDSIMVARAKENALRQGIENTDYFVADLTQVGTTGEDSVESWMLQKFDKILLDPPRSGAQEIVSLFKQFKAQTIVYVSCQPSSLVRDAKILCQQGYRLSKLGVMDMFPQTAHVESMAVFVRK